MIKIISVLPEWIKRPLRRIGFIIQIPIYYGNKRFCSVCGKSSGKFQKFGIVPREEAQCFFCGALERHRFLWLYLLEKTTLFDGITKKMLHVAPETCFKSKLREQLGDNYITADLSGSNVMVKMDITDIKYPDQSFDVIYCSHVLEHVKDDKKAISEFYRVLKNNGWAILLVPITREKTFEDPSITRPLDRLKAFGKDDHVRSYGLDYIDRLIEAGFNVKTIKVNDIVNEYEILKMRLTESSGEIYYCTK